MHIPSLPARLRPVRPGARGVAAIALTMVATLGVAVTANSAPAGHNTALSDLPAALASSSSAPSQTADSPPHPHVVLAASHATPSPHRSTRPAAKPHAGGAGTGAGSSANAAGAPAPAAVPFVQSAALPDPKSTAGSGNRPAPAGIRPTPAPTSPAGVSNSMSSVIAMAVLSMLNSERAANRLPGLHMNSRLISSAHAHNLTMARYDTMSHQLPGEPFFGDRILAAGYNYQYAGENVGWNSVETQQGALDLESVMYNEVPPNDGHRQNILSTNFVDVGIDIYFDSAHQKLWLTEDFGKSF